jgi:large subunit ribosomal protein L33
VRRPMRENIRLVSSAGTGFTYYSTKNKRLQQGKLELKKYDPVVRQHVVFKETKMPAPLQVIARPAELKRRVGVRPSV